MTCLLLALLILLISIFPRPIGLISRSLRAQTCPTEREIRAGVLGGVAIRRLKMRRKAPH
ncbi:hypothetical protein AAZX31_07G249400 [Glycine max]